MPVCACCKQERDLRDFVVYKDKLGRISYRTICTVCRPTALRMTDVVATQELKGDELRTCVECDESAPIGLYHLKGKDTLTRLCPTCNRARARGYYKKNSKKYIETHLEWRNNNREKFNKCVRDSYHRRKLRREHDDGKNE